MYRREAAISRAQKQLRRVVGILPVATGTGTTRIAIAFVRCGRRAESAGGPMTVAIERPDEGGPPPQPTTRLLPALPPTDPKVIGLSYLGKPGGLFGLVGVLWLAP